RGLKSHGQKDHLFVRVFTSYLESIERRVDDTHITALRLHSKKVLMAARHTQHVAEGTEDQARPGRQLNGLVQNLDRRYTDETTRRVDERDACRQEFVNAEADDGVRLAAADFHQGPWPVRDIRNASRHLLGRLRVAVFIEVLHGGFISQRC